VERLSGSSKGATRDGLPGSCVPAAMDGTVETGCARDSLAPRVTGRRAQLCLCVYEASGWPIFFEVPQVCITRALRSISCIHRSCLPFS
jgi:hypothetical protein